VLFFALAAPALAQQGTPASAPERTLDAVDSLVARGSPAEARVRLEEWWKSTAGGARSNPNLQARALFLRARLNTDPLAAQDDYLALALGHPTAAQTPAALLYLGQGLFALGEQPRAATYLERLSRDYPASPLRPTALLWLARVRMAAEQPNAACASVREGSAASHDPDLAALFRAEEARACALAASGIVDKPHPTVATPPQHERVSAAQPATSPTTRNGQAESSRATPAANLRFALQVGAFRQPSGAAALAARLRKAGFEPRIIFLPGNTLHRVRIGAFQTAAETAALARSVRAAGFEGVVVSDAASERPAP
jgi:tetratricopeptide (TPR) repeat protein